MIAMAVRHQDQVDLAELAGSLNSSGSLVAPLIQGSIMMTLRPGVVSLKPAWLNHRSSGLALRERGAGEREQALAVFQGGSCRFSVSA
jgi:hypothetical protein